METLALAFEEINYRRAEIDRLLREAFPDMNGEFYGSPNPWMLVLGQKDGEIIGHVAVYTRQVLIDEASTEIGLLGGVAIAAGSRGRGLLRPLVEEAHEQLRQRDIEFSVLFAFDHRHYTSSGYIPMANETRFAEAGVTKQFVYKGGMVACLAGAPWTARVLDLQGVVV